MRSRAGAGRRLSGVSLSRAFEACSCPADMADSWRGRPLPAERLMGGYVWEGRASLEPCGVHIARLELVLVQSRDGACPCSAVQLMSRQLCCSWAPAMFGAQVSAGTEHDAHPSSESLFDLARNCLPRHKKLVRVQLMSPSFEWSCPPPRTCSWVVLCHGVRASAGIRRACFAPSCA